MDIKRLLPSDEETLKTLDIDEVAIMLLRAHLDGIPRGEPRMIHVTNELRDGGLTPLQGAVASEALSWLQNRELLNQAPGKEPGWLQPSLTALALQSRNDFDVMRKADLLRTSVLDPGLRQDVFADFVRGDYESVVFKAYKAVEVAVRTAGGYSAGEIGTKLMRQAFHVEEGPLSNTSDEKSERQAIQDLFAGSIGAFKNPASHRNVALGPDDAVQLVAFASYLLRIVSDRRGIAS